MKKVLLTLAVLFVCAGLVFASGASESKAKEAASATPKKGGTLRVAVGADISSWNFTQSNAPEDGLSYGLVFETLFVENEQGEIQPNLALSISSDPKALTYTIKLREGVKFHDGTDFNAESCAFSLELYRTTGRKRASFMGNITSFEVTGPYEVTIHLSQWDSTIPRTLSRDCSYQISKVAYEKNGADWAAENPVGTGPFKFVEGSWQRDVKKSFVKFADYWKGEPYLDGAEVYIYPDSNTAQMAIETGELDAYYVLSSEMAKEFEEAGYYVSRGIADSMPLLNYHSVSPEDPFYDVKVRQAVSYAIDNKLLQDTIFSGYMSDTNQFCATTSPYYNESVEGYDYNVEKAKQLLAEAGYPNGFKTTIACKNEDDPRYLAQAIQEMLKAVNIEAEIIVVEAGDYGTYICGWNQGMFIHITSLPTAIINQAKSMFIQGLSGIVLGLSSFIHPDDLNDAIINASNALSEDDARAYMKEAQSLMIDKYCLYMPLGIGYHMVVVGNNLHDHNWGAVAMSRADYHLMWKD